MCCEFDHRTFGRDHRYCPHPLRWQSAHRRILDRRRADNAIAKTFPREAQASTLRPNGTEFLAHPHRFLLGRVCKSSWNVSGSTAPFSLGLSSEMRIPNPQGFRLPTTTDLSTK